MNPTGLSVTMFGVVMHADLDRNGWWIIDRKGFKNLHLLALTVATHENKTALRLTLGWLTVAAGWEKQKVKGIEL